MDLNDNQQQNFEHINLVTNLNSPSNIFSNVSVPGVTTSNINIGEVIPMAQQLVSTNSFELNVATSLSDDSGVPLTSSSISSGDSYRFGLCKLELELVESDGEVSQLDSLEDSSDGGMSGENFNTLKKGPLAPIDPPPEFQDSPQTTMFTSSLLQNYALYVSEHVITAALNCWLKNFLNYNKDNEKNSIIYYPSSFFKKSNNKKHEKILNDNICCNQNKHACTSDSLLTQCYNIYDDPENNLSFSYRHELEKNMISNNNQVKYDNRKNLQKLESVINPIAQEVLTLPENHNNDRHLLEIYDYNFYYALKRNYQKENRYQSYRKTSSSLLYSPLHHHHSGNNIPSLNRPNSRNSLNSRLSSSHNSLTVPNANKADDSIFITQAMSHDALLSQEISDFYNVPIGADIYSFPIDMIKPPSFLPSNQHIKDFNKPQNDNGYSIGGVGGVNNDKTPLLKGRFKNNSKNNKKRRRAINVTNLETCGIGKYENKIRLQQTSSKTPYKRHSVPENTVTPLHMTLDEVKRFYHSLYSSTNVSNETLTHINNNNNDNNKGGHIKQIINNDDKSCSIAISTALSSTTTSTTTTNYNNNNKNLTKSVNLKLSNSNDNKITTTTKYNKSQLNYKHDNNASSNHQNITPNNSNNRYNLTNNNNSQNSEKKSQFFINLNLKQKFCSIFRFRKNNDNNRRRNSSMFEPPDYISNNSNNCRSTNNVAIVKDDNKFVSRALPPLPNKSSFHNFNLSKNNTYKKNEKKTEFNSAIHFASNIEKVKDYGWYWGPISSEAAEKILSNEPDGSFIVRDSSDDHYIFSLSFKLNNCVRHVRIEQDQGTFSFGSYAKFKSQTITEFIEKAVEHSRSGRYLFFLHRRPEHGPMRVQLTNPVSRFKHIQSLQHMCRFVILKAVVRKDLIPNLPLPRRLLDYLSYKHCYSEQVECESSSQSQSSEDGQI